ncbi:NACHT, LRR and PYD domains-containing protein 1b allele 3 isoform X1 [Carassius carassius]|uniref:NACHT, LRR and PYD domains-containing protein 1b allele 3 isoform X1 n=1 Tax=Carassius carassius TaxID=217509 RepID=UPI0028694036|nr:NACHT, LRR and PYD domains-containing protein 1b allele 3 isoform X1 [Carassius carassius]
MNGLRFDGRYRLSSANLSSRKHRWDCAAVAARIMVAHMAHHGETTPLSDGNGEVSPSDLKDHPAESSPSSADNTSTEESSEEEEVHDEEEERDSDSDTRPRAEHHTASDEPLQSCCEKCRALKNPKFELVTPRKMSRDRLQLQLEAEGVYECSDTGLVFEVSQRVKITYCILSWSKFSTYLTGSWKFAGPIFDVDCDPSILKSVQFPHSLCLAADKENEVKFSVLHVKNSRGLIEPSVDHSGSHVRWNVSSLSPVGPIVQTSKSAEHHGVVQVFKEVGPENSFSFRVYLAGNNCSDIKDIRRAVRRANNCKNNKKYIQVDKPPTCMLEENRRYRLISEPMGHITPEDMLFSPVIVEVKGYFEVFFEESPPFKLSLTDADSGHTVWTATIREGDCVHHLDENPRKPSKGRKRHSSMSEEELCHKQSKKARGIDEPDCNAPAVAPDLTDQQLMQVAKRMGREWKVVAISCLGLSKQDLEEMEATEESVTMLKFNMLERWRRRQPKGRAGIQDLHKCLKDNDDVPNEVIAALDEMLQNNSAT